MKIAVAGGTGTVGRHVVDVVGERGHSAVVLSRSTGTDLVSGTGLARALEEADVVIDVSSVQTQSAKASVAFFSTVTRNLLNAERAAGVHHHVALSIVGSNLAPHGYYAGKAAQEHLISNGEMPWTVLRATQFHEFAQQIFGRFTVGPIHVIPVMKSQPVAAREVAEQLVTLAEGEPAGLTSDLAGPEVLTMADMVHGYAAVMGRPGRILEVPLPGGFGTAMRDGTLLATEDAERGRQTFQQWLGKISGGAT